MVSGGLLAAGEPLITFSLSFDALQEFVEDTNSRFKHHDKRISALENQISSITAKNSELERVLQDRHEEIMILRSECKQTAARVVDVEEQSKGVREENALAFSKVHKKLESSATSEGLQKEMLSLKEGNDNRMLVLENMMREIGGDKMKTLITDVSSLQHDSVALWKENARLILEIEQRAHLDQVRDLQRLINKNRSDIETIQLYTNESAAAIRQQEMDQLRNAIDNTLKEAEDSSRIVKQAVHRTDLALLAKKETDGFIDVLREELSGQSKGLMDAQNLVRALLGAQKRFAVELDEVVSKNNRTGTSKLADLGGSFSKLDMEAHRAYNQSGGTVSFVISDDRPTDSENEDSRANTPLSFRPVSASSKMPSFPPGRVRRPQSAAPLMLGNAKGASKRLGGSKSPGRPSSSQSMHAFSSRVSPSSPEPHPMEAKRIRPTSPHGGVTAWGQSPIGAIAQSSAHTVSADGTHKKLHPLPTDLLMDIGR